MTKAFLIVNPSSGGEEAKQYEDQATAKLQELFQEVIVKHTEKAGDATDFAKEAAKERIDSVFAMGGDGTVNEVISGLAEEEFRPTFGFFPLGTVNDLGRALNLPMDPEEAISQLSLDRTSSLDIGKINDQYFMNVVAIGTIPESINDVDVEDKTKFGKLAYFASGIKHVIGNKSYDFEVTLDEKTQEITSSTIIIALTRSVGGFEQLLADAEVNDGKMHAIYLKDESLLDTVKSLPDLIKGVDKSTDNLGYETFSKGQIALKEGELGTNIDGDEGPKLPIHLEILPSHLTVYTGKAND
ncbi:diacylglycerol kinase family lipid kinase [Enterococcus saccharolyticus]|uniref:Diacylglycerol kinase n=1 Tax=Candidatus Enterococcus willemsii TaxID=1857215 RepID=A0ABQ6YZ13_9ENTE|nr:MULTISPECIES: diacylglycerol kinase family protein [Enterococcus]KAF1303221.1 diacylglycerol kinase [Enterococcus sp. CU12B]MCD5001816.1 diacylglycerol kinase family lipid kinase [Enterococcus saccharolyticus]